MEKQIELTLEMAQQMFKSNVPLLKETALKYYTEEELDVTQVVKTWNMFDKVVGFYVSNDSAIRFLDGKTMDENKNIFATQEQATASLAMAQLTQLMNAYNEGWIPDWKTKTNKFTIAFIGDEIEVDFFQTKRHFLAFKTIELRDEFLKNCKDLIILARPLM